ncbi:MAG: cyclic nucleotide-binding domain-containing protein [Gammaproteobacteria bacterium]|nr:cyclic nucleotide-binding domain-containing protein [Gammaproteobacteria bacterium]MBU1969863.1 cyclic nucleotide-binding domain-containing protein [Gammaproteobacteria bacterium]
MNTEQFKVVIIGGGPGGLSAAVRATELGISHVLLEGSPHLANTIRHFQKGKLVMAEPSQLPLRSALPFGAGVREHILQQWRDEVAAKAVNCRTDATVTGISGRRGDFCITLADGEPVKAECVVLAIGVQGNIRKLDVPGENLPGVQYHLDDPDEFANETIVVVGGGDAGVENALALCDRNRVILINRQDEFSNCREANFDLLMAAVSEGRMEIRVNTWTEQVVETGGGYPLLFVAQTPQGKEKIACHRVIARLGAVPPRKLLESFGIRIPNSDMSSVPQINERYESNVPGLYIVGALAGYSLIKQAINQGCEAIEYILGLEVEPADEGMLRERFAHVRRVGSVNEGIELVKENAAHFEVLNSLQLRELVQHSQLRDFLPGEVVFERNDYSNSFFSILSGSVSIETEDEEGSVANFILSAGNFFGEMGLLSGRRRSGTVIAGDDCVLLETPRRYMLNLLNSSTAVRRKLDEVALKRIVQTYLDAGLSESELDYLVHDAKLKCYCVGETIFKEGDKADGLYMIRRGSVTVSRLISGKEVVLAYVSAGNYVGEMGLVSNSPRSATVRAASPTEVVLLEAERVKSVLERNSSIRCKVDGRYLEHVHSGETGPLLEHAGMVKFLLDQGVGEATDVLLIDYSRCIRCNNCEKACADVNGGASRLNSKAGATYEYLHLPASCRHCEHPHCMKDCPPDAIHRSVNGEVFIGDSCVGCGNCQRNCPYDVIQMVSTTEHPQPTWWQVLFGQAATTGKTENSNEPKKAVKCDMCKEIIAGPACVRLCPTGAAMRVSPEALLGFMKES